MNIQNGKSNGRSVYQSLMDGRITITGKDRNGRRFQRVVQCVGGEIMDNSLREGHGAARSGGNGRLAKVHHIVYGKFEVTRGKDGRREVVSFAPGGTGKHGKSRRWEKLFGRPGLCHSWFKHGRLVRQKFIYDSGRQAYDFKRGAGIVRDHRGKMLYVISGALDGRNMWPGHSVLARPMGKWFLHSKPFSVSKGGREIFAGQYIRGQKTGRWVESGRVVYYEHGVAIPRKLYETPADKLDPRKLLRIDNAQLRMALLGKIGAARVAKIGRVVHKDGDMRLYDVPGMDVRILKVVCPSTKSVYHIRVPKDSTKCEEARQWTFHLGAGVTQRIKFAVET